MGELQKKPGGEIALINKQQFMELYNPVKMIETHANITTVAQAIEADKNGISFYSKQIGPDAVLALIELHLVTLNQSVNVGQPLTKFQVKEIAIEIRAVYYFLSMVEIQFVFRKAKRGDFGQLYGALNIVAILDWFRQYTDERVQVYQQKSQHEAELKKKGTKIELDQDGNPKLYKNQNDVLDQSVVKVLKNVSKELPKEFDEEAFKEWKQDYNENGLKDE